MRKITFAGYSIALPRNRIFRTLIGSILVILGLFGFLPLLGFWMIPLGLLILSVDIAIIRRWRRIWTVRIGSWLKARHPKIARSLGYTASDG
jgi:hypothetical protein